MLMKIVTVVAAGIALAGMGGWWQSVASDKDVSAAVDEYVRREMRAEQIPGLALGVMRDGVLMKAQGYGSCNLELSVAVKPESMFQTGSVGKQFTATAVMMLVEEGKVKLDDPVSKYLPGTPPSWREITVRNLLTHTSGVADYETENSIKPGGLINLRQDYTEDELFQKIITMPLDFQPGEKWKYSNTGYVLLGFLIHKVTGEFYGDYLQQRIFQPLGMNATRIISEADIIPNRCAGYALVKGELKNQEWVSPTINTTADGALYTNVLDMARWDAALYTEKLLKKSSLQQIWTPVRLRNGKTYPYGFGWDVTEVNGHRLIAHDGAWQGFTTNISRYTDDKLTVVVLTNLDSEHAEPWKIARNVAGLYVPAVKPAELAPIEDKNPQVTALLRATIEWIAAGKVDPATFAPDFRKTIFPEGIAAMRENIQAYGDLKTVQLLGQREDASDEGEMQPVFVYRLAFEKKTVNMELTLDHNGKIAGLEPASE
jgi:CubicO group peptidase (beta-lactamase class C family)